MSNKKSLFDRYDEAKNAPTPLQALTAEVAQITGNTESTVRGWFQGQRRPTLGSLRLLALAWDMDVEEIWPEDLHD